MDWTEPPENLTQLCRLCASNDDVQINIFSDKGREKQLVEKIFSCLSVKISQSEELPNSVCYKCMTCLENYYDFRCKCLSVISKLEQLSSRFQHNEQNVSLQIKKEPNDHCGSPSAQPTDFSKTRYLGNESRDPAVFRAPDLYKFTCQACGEAFLNQNELFIHSKACRENKSKIQSPPEPDRPYRCDICSKSFSVSKQLWSHMASTHQNHPSVFCTPCSRTFSSPAYLLQHQRSKHAVPGPSNASSNSPSVHSNSVSNSENNARMKNYSLSLPPNLQEILDSMSKKRSIDEASGSRRKNSVPRKISRGAEDEDVVPRKIFRGPEEEARDVEMQQNHFLYADNGNLTANSSSSTSSPILIPSFHNSNIYSNYRNSSSPNTTVNVNSKAKLSLNGNLNMPPLIIPSNTHHNTLPPSHSSSKSKNVSNTSNQNRPSVKAHQPKESLKCLLCEKTFTRRPLLNKHIRAVHGIDTTEVTLGKISRPVVEEDIENMMEAETVFCCEICTREFNDRSSMWLHMLHAHKREAGLACGLCLKVCSDRQQLSEHLETHQNDGTDQKRFCCSFCGRQDDARPKLIKHAAVHGTTVNTIEIVISNPRYHSHSNHSASQNKAPPVVPPGSVSCQICSRVFGDEEKLIKHCQNAHKSLSLLDHTNNLIFSCEICSTSFSSRSERWTHIYKDHTTDPRVACPIKTCKKVFSSHALLSGHAATHHQEQGEYPNVCEMCGKLFQQRSEFYKHMMGVHPHTLPFVCGVCLKILCSIDELKAHVRDEHEPLPELNEQIRCDICARPYLKHSKMVRHRAMHNDGTEAPKLTRKFFEKPESLNCALCPDAEAFETIEILSEHRRKDHNLMVCDLCPKFYAKCSHLWKHVHRCHPGHPDVTCKICSKTSASRIHLKRHIAKLHKDSDLYNPADDPHYKGEDYPHMAASGPHTCEKCKRVFRKYSLLNKHFKHCSGPRPPLTPIPAMVDGVYPCSKCSKSFVLPTALRKHIRSSHIPQVCELCPEMSYDTKQELMDHVREKHITDPLLKCQAEGCSRLFRLKADAERHKKEHASRYYSHLCNFCGDVFTNRNKLRKHLKSNHKQQTQFLCYICFEPEVSLQLLAEHVLENHKSMLKHFVCQMCGKNHSSGSKANEHIRAIHGNEYKPCPVCWKIFTDTSELDTHVENHPQETPEEKPQPVKKPAAKRPSNPNSKINKELAALTENSADFLSATRMSDEGSSNEVSKRLRRMFSCISCTQSFRVINDLINHRRSIHDEYCCSSCAKQFILEIDFNDHIKICDALEEGFVMSTPETPKHETPAPSSSSSSVERRTVWAAFDGQTACELCDKVWTSLKHYWQHLIRTHKEVAPFACGVCLKLCSDYDDLAFHLDDKHLGTFTSKGNNFVCRVCGRYHNAQGKLQIHMSTHTGMSNVSTNSSIRCRHCELVFKTQKFFDEHMEKDHAGISADAMPSSLEEDEDVKHEIDADIEEVESDAENDETSKSKKDDVDDDEEGEGDDDDDDDDEEDDNDDEDEDDENDDVEADDVENESEKNNDDDDDDEDADDIEDDVDNDDIEAEDIDDDDDDEDDGIDDEDDIDSKDNVDDEDEIDELDDPDEDEDETESIDADPLPKKTSINQLSGNDQIKLKELKLVVPNLKINCNKLGSSLKKEDSMDCDSESKDNICQLDAETNVPNYSQASPCIS